MGAVRVAAGVLVCRRWLGGPGMDSGAGLMAIESAPSRTARPRALIVTLCSNGGVAALVAAAQRLLAERGLRPDLAWYEPWRLSPDLSVPLPALPFRRPRLLRETLPDGSLLHRVGVRLPELEALRYRPSALWRRVLADYDVVLAVCGSVLQAGVLLDGAPGGLAWVSSPYDADRAERRRRFSAPRRLFDRLVDAPLARRLERRLLRRLPLITISRYSAEALERLASGLDLRAIVPCPLDLEELRQRPWPAPPDGTRRIGFFGRHGDPRKRIGLLLEAFALLAARRPETRLVLAGEPPTAALRQRLAALGLTERVELHDEVPRARLLDLYGDLELFVIPSEQEGLGIVGLEAMATGRPVLSTRCGGPEEFVLEGETGWLVEATPQAMAARLDALLAAPEALRAAGARARALMVERYGHAAVAARFHRVFAQVAGDP